MKANKVPEKLYGCYKGNGNLFVDYRPFPNEESIEYTRTDVFIEKAEKWLDKTLRDTDFYENEIELFIKEFKKAMKL